MTYTENVPSAYPYAKKARETKESTIKKLFGIYSCIFWTGLHYQIQRQKNITSLISIKAKKILVGVNLLKQSFWKNMMPSSH